MQPSKSIYLMLAAIAVVLLGVANNINWGGDHWRSVLQADAKGYYAYLPAVFIYHDLSFNFLEEAEASGSNPNLYFDFRVAYNGRTVNKYWCGTAVMQMPFFLVAHGWSKLTGSKPNGYSKPYVVMIGFAAIVYAVIGLWAIANLLGSYQLAIADQWWLLVFLMFGTHLFYYTIVAPGMSHVYSFSLVAIFFLTVRTKLGSARPHDLLFMAAVLGLIVLVRPVNGIVVLAVPFLMEEWSHLKEAVANLIKHSRALLAATVMTAGLIALQPLAYYLGCGSWWLDTYPGEEFDWKDPHILDILFSYKKGLFLYTPICLVALLGVWRFARRSIFAALAWSGFFLLITYVFSCWWNWWYGGSFSSRPYVEFLPLFGIPPGMMLKDLRKRWRVGLLTLLCVFTVLCQVQTYQARYYRIHYEDMDRQRYWDEFLRLDKIAG